MPMPMRDGRPYSRCTAATCALPFAALRLMCVSQPLNNRGLLTEPVDAVGVAGRELHIIAALRFCNVDHTSCDVAITVRIRPRRLFVGQGDVRDAGNSHY